MRIAALLLVVLLGGCSLAPVTELPRPPVPVSWPVGDAYLAANEAALPVIALEDIFRDPRLLTLIDAALADNRDLRIAFADLVAARAAVRVVRAGQLPSVSVGAGVSGTGRDGDTATDFALSGGVSRFEIDVFGGLANATKAERSRAFATEAVARTIRVALIADLADAYATYAANRDLLAIARATADNARDSVRLTRLRLEGGVAPRTDLAQAQQVLATAEQSIAEQTALLAQDVNRLRLLAGREIGPTLLPAGLAEIAPRYAAVPAGADTRVLLRRPDVIEAEYRLRAANADIGVARARLFPTLSLSGLVGLAGTALGNLFSGGGLSATGGIDAGQVIFDAGGRRAGVAVSEAQRDAAIAGYERAIQVAFREVADALADQGTLDERARAAAANGDAAAVEARLTEARYRAGVDSFLDNLLAQRSLFTARRQEAQVELARLRNRATVYRVLGGDRTAAIPTPN